MERENRDITIADVAEALGVSKTTVSRAISGKGRIGKETRERVMTYVEEHGYRPNVVAKGLAQSRTYNLCVVMPEEYEVADLPFFQDCLRGIQEIAGNMGYDILLSICGMNDISSLERVIANHKADGVLLARTYAEDAQIAFLQQKGTLFVAIGSAEQGVIQVDHDHRSACRELTSILLMRGWRRIALIGGNMAHMVTRCRLQGFRDAYGEIGETPDEELFFLGQDNNVLLEKTVRKILGRKADCILCMDDMATKRVLKLLQAAHVSIPQDIRLASFYGSSILGNEEPPITSLSFDAKELGMVACRTLLDMLAGLAVRERTLLPYEIVLKESTK